MSGGSYLRFIIGLVLSLSVLVSFLTGEKTTILSALLAIILIILGVLWFAFKF
jgi:LPXTG-motif cell wall-anchored protein